MADDYFKIRAVSNSALNWFERSPKYFRYRMDNDIEEKSDYFDLGTLVHKFLLEPMTIERDILIWKEEDRPENKMTMQAKANKQWLASMEAQAKRDGQQLISHSLYKKAALISDNAFNNVRVREFLTSPENKFETIHLWNLHGIDCKCKVDIENPYFIADIKTAENADPYEWQRKSWYYGYPRQGAMYSDGVSGGGFKPGDRPFYFIVIEKEAPYDVSIHEIFDDLMKWGLNKYRNYIKDIAYYEQKQEWPGYESKTKGGITFWELPPWVR